MSASGNRRVVPAILAALVALAIAVLVATLTTGGARADDSFTSDGDAGLTVPGDHSAGDQYVETLPTITGSRAPRKSKRAKKLPKHVAKQLERFGGSDARTLEQLAGSVSLGAPGEGKRSKNASANGKGSQQGRAPTRGGGPAPAVPAAAIIAADRGEAGLEWLAIAILAITALSLGAVGYQRRRDKDSTSR